MHFFWKRIRILESIVDSAKDFKTVDSEPENVTSLDEKLLENFFIRNDNDVDAISKSDVIWNFVCLATEKSTKNYSSNYNVWLLTTLLKKKSHWSSWRSITMWSCTNPQTDSHIIRQRIMLKTFLIWF